jgi:flagellar motor protein MotB
MRYGKLGLLAILLWTPACVPLSQYKKLEQRCEEQEAYVVGHKDKVRELEQREQVMTLRAREQERQLELLRARLEKSERLRNRMNESMQAQPMMASAPVEQAPPTVVGLTVNPATNGLVMESGLLFSPGSATLKANGRKVLDRVRNELNKPEYMDKSIRIDGHTDDSPIQRSRGKNASNWDLAGKRALAVLHYLEATGVDPNRLSFSGYGPHQPIDSGSSKASKAKNRRVEIVLFD